MQGDEESKDLSILSKIFKGTAVVTDIHFIKENTTRIMKERKKNWKKNPTFSILDSPQESGIWKILYEQLVFWDRLDWIGKAIENSI